MSKPKFETKREKELRVKIFQTLVGRGIISNEEARPIVNVVMSVLREEGIITEPLPSLTISRDTLRRGGQ